MLPARLKKFFRFVYRHWYIFPLIKITVVSTAVITLAEDDLIQFDTSNYVCQQMVINSC